MNKSKCLFSDIQWGSPVCSLHYYPAGRAVFFLLERTWGWGLAVTPWATGTRDDLRELSLGPEVSPNFWEVTKSQALAHISWVFLAQSSWGGGTTKQPPQVVSWTTIPSSASPWPAHMVRGPYGTTITSPGPEQPALLPWTGQGGDRCHDWHTPHSHLSPFHSGILKKAGYSAKHMIWGVCVCVCVCVCVYTCWEVSLRQVVTLALRWSSLNPPQPCSMVASFQTPAYNLGTCSLSPGTPSAASVTGKKSCRFKWEQVRLPASLSWCPFHHHNIGQPCWWAARRDRPQTLCSPASVKGALFMEDCPENTHSLGSWWSHPSESCRPGCVVWPINIVC